uniref:Uncharacterized protein n=1 Tax=Parascaris univalens TaxID=6257 RepID=A0A915C719_PARUN
MPFKSSSTLTSDPFVTTYDATSKCASRNRDCGTPLR